MTYHGIAWAHFCAGRYDDASAWAEKVLAEAPNYAPALRALAAAHALAGRLEQAQKAVARMREVDSPYRISDVKDRIPSRPEHAARFEEGCEKRACRSDCTRRAPAPPPRQAGLQPQGQQGIVPPGTRLPIRGSLAECLVCLLPEPGIKSTGISCQ
jgi:hypothetical protein